MILELAIGTALIVSTILVESLFIAGGVEILNRFVGAIRKRALSVRIGLSLSLAGLWSMIALVICVWMWAGCFLLVGEFVTVSEALYFTVVAFTTLGFGDVLLEEWRLLSGLCAANGLIIFSMITAFLLEVLQSVMAKDTQRL